MLLETILYPLTSKNILSYCAAHYKNNSCICEKEFQDDAALAKKIRKIILQKQRNEKINDRVLTNHIIIMCNVFGVLPAIRIILFFLEEHHYDDIFPIFYELNMVNKYIIEIVKKYDKVEIYDNRC